MATRSRWLKKQKTEDKEQQADSKPATPEGEVAPTPSLAPTPSQAGPTMHKGVYLSALIYVEGDMAAPEDFTSSATTVLRATLREALTSDHNGLSMSLKKVEVQNDVEQEDSGESVADKKPEEEKFQF